jgi:hypothetical protein
MAYLHPAGGLPPGQTYHAAGPTEGGWLIAAVWDSKDSFDRFLSETPDSAMCRVASPVLPRNEALRS